MTDNVPGDQQFHTMPLGPFLRTYNGAKNNIEKEATVLCRNMGREIR